MECLEMILKLFLSILSRFCGSLGEGFVFFQACYTTQLFPSSIFTLQMRYMEMCGVPSKTYREVEVTLKTILSKHDTLEGNRLSLEGFLSHYREVAATDPRQVIDKWALLRC